MAIDWEAQRLRNIEHADNPQPGDVWQEMLNFTCKVLCVGPDYVAFRKREGDQIMSRAEFAKWLRYTSMPDKTWTDLCPMSFTE